ncbi:uncharacterized protein DS421_14g466580 [Arachis hypogaea]|nr:uncharacterized protein DS421_14g466580 [Arachis hypogaea]
MKGARTHALSLSFTGATSRVAVAEEGRSTSFRHHRRRRCCEEEREIAQREIDELFWWRNESLPKQHKSNRQVHRVASSNNNSRE